MTLRSRAPGLDLCARHSAARRQKVLLLAPAAGRYGTLYTPEEAIQVTDEGGRSPPHRTTYILLPDLRTICLHFHSHTLYICLQVYILDYPSE